MIDRSTTAVRPLPEGLADRIDLAAPVFADNGLDATRIDDLKLKDVTAIKIDAERHEAKVLRGAMVTITRDRPVIIDAIQAPDAVVHGDVVEEESVKILWNGRRGVHGSGSGGGTGRCSGRE